MENTPQVVVTPLANADNLLESLRMLLHPDPLTPLFVRGVLTAFGQTTPKDLIEQMKELLHLWDTRIPNVTSSDNSYQREIIEAARTYIQYH